MWPFKKRPPSPPDIELDLEGSWVNLRIDNDERPGFVRVNAGLKKIAGHPAYHHEAVISIPFHEVRDNGLPSSEEELTAVEEIEDKVRAALQANRESLLAVVHTRDGRRDLVFYTSNPEAVVAWFERQKLKKLSHRLKLSLRPDARWETYRAYPS
jgi:hypothetical protein